MIIDMSQVPLIRYISLFIDKQIGNKNIYFRHKKHFH